MKRNITIKSVVALTALAAVLGLLSQDSLRAKALGQTTRQTAAQGIPIEDVLPFETEFVRHVNDALRGTNLSAGTQIVSTKVWMDIVDKCVWKCDSATLQLAPHELQSLRELIQRKVDVTRLSSQAGTNFGVGAMSADFFVEKIPPMPKAQIDLLLQAILSGAKVNDQGEFQFQMERSTEMTQTYEVSRSENFSNWEVVGSILMTNNCPVNIIDPSPLAASSFYRIVGIQGD